VVRLLDSFELEFGSQTPNLVLVFERMGMNLRQTLDKFGRNVGLSMDAVKNFALQLFSVLAKFKELGLVHADLKPENSRLKVAIFLGDFLLFVPF
jgi:serine/threonine-protein kinase PRP4